MSASIKEIIFDSESDWSLCLENSSSAIGLPLEDTAWTKMRVGLSMSIYSSSHATIGSSPKLAIGLGNDMELSIYGADSVRNFIGIVCVPTSFAWNATYNHYDAASTNGTLRKVVNSVETNASSVLNAWDLGSTTNPPSVNDIRTGLFVDIFRSGSTYYFRCFTKTSSVSTDLSDVDFVDLMEAGYQLCSKTGYSYYSERNTTLDETIYPLNSLSISWNKSETLAIHRLAYSFLF
jgi:hypothetical protein